MIKRCMEGLLGKQLPPIALMVDNKSLFESAHTTNSLAEKRLRVDMSALRQMCERKEVELQWIATSNQLADALTKAGASKQKLLNILKKGSLEHGC